MLKACWEELMPVLWIARALPRIVRAAWRQKRGRWYYLRNEPRWIVVPLARLACFNTGEEKRADFERLYTEARREWSRRRNQRLREKGWAV